MESRTSVLMRPLSSEQALRALCATVLMTAAVAIVLFMRIGPVVLTLAPGRGIHTGDSLGLLGAVTAALMIGPVLRSTPPDTEPSDVAHRFRG